MRISLVGGGTDLPFVYKEIGFGKVLSLSIQKYIYLGIHPLVEDTDILIKYSKTEKVQKAENLKHPVAREVIKMFPLEGLDIFVTSDIPAGTGMGSSSSFTVGILHLMCELTGKKYDRELLAKWACEVEIDILREPIGKQDQYIAAYGGVRSFTFYDNEQVVNKEFSHQMLLSKNFEEKIHLVRVGSKRDARDILSAQRNDALHSVDKFKRYVEIRNLVSDAEVALEKYNFEELGKIITESWKIKKTFSRNISNPEVDKLISNGLSMGAWGAKLLGAGGAGYVMFLGEDSIGEQLINKYGPRYLNVKVDYMGSCKIYED